MTDVYMEKDKENEEGTLEFRKSHGQKTSIDLSLELERELDALENATSDPSSLNTQALSSYLAQLRESVAELTQTRDDLITSLAQSKKESAERQHNLEIVEQREQLLQQKVNELDEQTRADKDTINLLRQKVEESRRGLMRLQTEHKRSSSVVQPLSLDLSKPGSTAKGSGRTSLGPGGSGQLSSRLSGPSPIAKGHRRFSSVAIISGRDIDLTPADDSTQDPALEQARPVRNPNRLSRLIGGELAGPAPPLTAPLPNQETTVNLAASLRTALSEIEELKTRLAESEEAKEASDSCVKALREFIEHHRIGELVPGEPIHPIPERKNEGNNGVWGGMKLWRTDSNTKSNEEVSLTASRRSSASSPKAVPPSSVLQSPTPSKGLFGLNFFSTAPKTLNGQQETMCNGSDTSSDGRRSMSPSSGMLATSLSGSATNSETRG